LVLAPPGCPPGGYFLSWGHQPIPPEQEDGKPRLLIWGEWWRLGDESLDVFLGAGCAKVTLCSEKVWIIRRAVAAQGGDSGSIVGPRHLVALLGVSKETHRRAGYPKAVNFAGETDQPSTVKLCSRL